MDDSYSCDFVSHRGTRERATHWCMASALEPTLQVYTITFDRQRVRVFHLHYAAYGLGQPG